jgi:hypothetical protein
LKKAERRKQTAGEPCLAESSRAADKRELAVSTLSFLLLSCSPALLL